MQSSAEAFHQQRLEELSAQPNKTVYTVKHDRVREAWPVARVRPVLERIAEKVHASGKEESEFKMRRRLLDEDEEVRAFQRDHPKLYWLVTDRKVVGEAKFRQAISGLLAMRDRVESGQVSDEKEADAMATRVVMNALGPASG